MRELTPLRTLTYKRCLEVIWICTRTKAQETHCSCYFNSRLRADLTDFKSGHQVALTDFA